MKDVVQEVGKAFGEAILQFMTLICIGITTGAGIAIGFWLTSVYLQHYIHM